MASTDPFANRYGNNKSGFRQNAKANFCLQIDQKYVQPLLDSHLKILNAKKTQFVGIKTLNYALRFVGIALKTAKTRKMCQEHIELILFQLTLPLLLLTEAECNIWNENPIEYVRLQVDK